jgi:alkyl hydroperoxide reductase 1
MPQLQVGDRLPEGVKFNYIPIDLQQVHQEDVLACAQPLVFDLDKQLAKLDENSNVLLVAVPGAFTPTCTENHIPPYLEKLVKLKEEYNVALIIIISTNDAFVLNAWAKLLLRDVKATGKEPRLVFASDGGAQFSQKFDLSVDARARGMGVRTARYAIAFSKDRLVKYVGKEVDRSVRYSGVDAVVAKL